MPAPTPVYVAGNHTVHAGYPAGLIPGTQTTRYRKACSAMSRHERHYPSPLEEGTPITCKRCLAKLAGQAPAQPARHASDDAADGQPYDRVDAKNRWDAGSGQEEERLERELALQERWHTTGLLGEGPLTQEQAASEASYERYLEESEREELERSISGGRTICPLCGARSVVHRSVATYGGGLPGSEYSDLAECERSACSYRSL